MRSMIPNIAENNVPFITTDQMREVDRLMIEDYGIQLLQMMENAGRNLADLARSRFLEGDPRGQRVVVLAGTGGNGGGGLAAARRLHGWGAHVEVWTTRVAKQMAEVPRHQLNILERFGIPIYVAEFGAELSDANLIVDAIVGYGLNGAASGTAAAFVVAANTHTAPVLALDVPTGLSTTTGEAFDPAIRATATLTLALPKVGLRSGDARAHVGELYVADISVPPLLYAEPSLNIDVGPIFAESDIVRVW